MKLNLKVTAIVDAALEGLASLTQQDFAAVPSPFYLIIIAKIKIITKIEMSKIIIYIITMIR